MSSNGQAEVGRALELLREGLGPFVEQAVRNKPLKRHIEDFLSSNSRKKLKGKRVTEWDVAALMNFMQHMWHEVFRHVLGRSERAFVSELQDCRNKWAHQERLAPEDVLRHLDSAARLLRAINAESQADKVAELRGRFIQAGRTPSPRHDPLPSSPQPSAPHRGQADAIREYALAAYVVPWRKSDADVLTIRAGDVERRMGLRNATPNVCSALEGRKFLALANLELMSRDGPRRSTTTTYHYRRTN